MFSYKITYNMVNSFSFTVIKYYCVLSEFILAITGFYYLKFFCFFFGCYFSSLCHLMNTGSILGRNRAILYVWISDRASNCVWVSFCICGLKIVYNLVHTNKTVDLILYLWTKDMLLHILFVWTSASFCIC